MKKLIFILVVVAAGYLVYTNFFQISAEEKLVRSLEKEFQTATQNYIAANRQAAEPGLVVISDPEKRKTRLKKLRKNFRSLSQL
jgi:hypothetical protein